MLRVYDATMYKHIAVICVALYAPFCGAASPLLISEIHYNPVGTDDKHEFIEICNAGDGAVDVAGYKLYESSSNHTLTLARGASVLASAQCAVLVTDPPTFLSDFPSFSATLFDTTFSLSNTGEVLILRDQNGADVDGISYAPSQGGNGDGQSLHRTGTTFVGGVVSPGNEAGLSGSAGSQTATTDTQNTSTAETSGGATSTTVFHTVTIEPPPQLFVRVPEKIVTATGSVVHLSAESYNAKGAQEDAQYVWVYGDGMRDATSQNAQRDVTHVYRHAGEYAAVVTATKGGLTGEASVHVVVQDAALLLELSDDETSVVLHNAGEIAVDVSGMRLVSEFQTYTFPDKTRILPKQSLTLVLNDIGITDPRTPKTIALRSAGGALVGTAQGRSTAHDAAPTARSAPLAPMTVLAFGAQVQQEAAVHQDGVHTIRAASHDDVQKEIHTFPSLDVKKDTQKEAEVRERAGADAVVQGSDMQTAAVAGAVEASETTPLLSYVYIGTGALLLLGSVYVSRKSIVSRVSND